MMLGSPTHITGFERMNSIARGLRALLLVFVIAACSPAADNERKAIFAALSAGRDQADLVFVTSAFNVEGDWAWVTADPQSKDGTQHYETESWLLHKQDGRWSVAAQPCAEEGCDPKEELAKIRERFPQAPAAIFPAG